MSSINETISSLTEQANHLKVREFLAVLATEYPSEVIFSTSFSYEDQVITDLILSNDLPITLFTLDTGRLFPETYSVWNATQDKYNTRIETFIPDNSQLQHFISKNGPNSFYDNVENRKACCHIRKVEPLKRALKGKSVWITGLRAEHSPARQEMPLLEWDETNEIIKYHPLLHWTTEEIEKYIRQHHIPYNSLHDRGFVSIGCAPCTRAVKPGESFRAGRWWWEEDNKKECGLHIEHHAKIINLNA